MPFTTDITTISVVVAMTTPSRVRKDRSLWLRSSPRAFQKASRTATQKPVCCRRLAGDLATAVRAELEKGMLATFIVRSGKGLLGGAAGSVFAVFAEGPGGV